MIRHRMAAARADLQATSMAPKWSTARVFILYIFALAVCIPIVLLPFAIRKLQAGVEFGILVLAPRLWSSFHGWLRPPYLYLVLNVVIVTLGVKSGVLGSSGNGKSFPDEALSQDRRAEDKLRLRNAAGNYVVKALGDLNCTEKLLASVESLDFQANSKCEESYAADRSVCNKAEDLLIVMDVCSDRGIHHMLDIVPGNCREAEEEGEEEEEEEEDGETLSAEELYVKAEVFIGNFYRDLKLQRQY